MYSNSQSFLGGGSNTRPGAQQYGQSQSYQQQAPQGFQQQSPFAPQATGFQQQNLQPQATGYPLQQPNPGLQNQIGGFQAQATGYPGQSQQAQATGYEGFQSSHQLPQQLQSPSSIIPTKTGQTSSQIAASFGGSGVSQARSTSTLTGVKIPKIRLSFLTAQDQAKFEQLFKSAVGNDQALSGEMNKEISL